MLCSMDNQAAVTPSSGVTSSSDTEGDGEGPSGVDLGSRLRALRLGRGLTLRKVALVAGTSHSMLSQIELGRSQPSVSTLGRIARVYGTTLAELFGDQPASEINVVRRHDRVPLPCLSEGVIDLLVVPDAGGFSMITSLVPPQVVRTRPISHPAGQEAIYVVRGSLEVHLDDVATTLYVGDAIWFDSNQEHSIANPSWETTEILCVISGPGNVEHAGNFAHTAQQDSV